MHHLLPYSDSCLYWCLAYMREGSSDLRIYVAVTSPYPWNRGVTKTQQWNHPLINQQSSTFKAQRDHSLVESWEGFNSISIIYIYVLKWVNWKSGLVQVKSNPLHLILGYTGKRVWVQSNPFHTRLIGSGPGRVRVWTRPIDRPTVILVHIVITIWH